MKGDFTRITHVPRKHYTQVLKQQGRVGLDADDNEQAAIADRLRRATTLDVVGPSGAPKDGGGFKVEVDAATGEVRLRKGRMYAQGALCELEADATYATQPDLPGPPAYAPPTSGERIDLVYLDAWDRHVTAVEDPALLDPALGGIDTASRVRTVAQVRILVGAADAKSCARPGDAWARAIRPSGARLTTRSQPTSSSANPCLVVEGGGYRGLENRLYRVEIHDGGEPYAWPHSETPGSVAVQGFPAQRQVRVAETSVDGRPFAPGQWVELSSQRTRNQGVRGLLARVEAVDADVLTLSEATTAFANDADRRVRRVATWKWSRDNGSVLYPRAQPDPETSHTGLTVAHAGRDDALRLARGQWVEALGDASELHGRPGTLAEVQGVSPSRVVLLSRNVSAHKLEGHAKLRRWDQGSDVLPVRPGEDVHLEDGVIVSFGGERFRTGDHWSFAARTAEADVERLTDEPPQGIRHRHARLAFVRWHHENGVRKVTVRDCRGIFLPLTRRPDCCTVTVGNGVDSHGEYDTVQEAVDALPDEGGCVRILPGDHLLGQDPVQLTRDGIHLVGCGPLTRLLAPPGEPAVVVWKADRCSLEGVTLVAQASDVGALLVGGSEGFSLTECEVENDAPDAKEPGEMPALLAMDADGLLCKDLDVRGSTLTGHVGASLRVHGLRFTGNELPRGGLWLRTGTRDADVRDNDLGDAAGAPGWGVLLGGHLEGDGEEPDAWREGRASDGDAAGEWLGAAAMRFLDEDVDMPMQDVTLERNRIQGMDEAGIGWRLLGGMRRLRLVDNLVQGCARAPTDPVGSAVAVALCDDLLMRGNRVRGNGPGKPTFGVLALGCRSVVMEGNRVTGNGVEVEPPEQDAPDEPAKEEPPQDAPTHRETATTADPKTSDTQEANTTDNPRRGATTDNQRTYATYATAMREEPDEPPRQEVDGFPFQAAVVVAAFGGEGKSALEMRGNLFACPRGPALLAGVLGSGAVVDNELLARGDWSMGSFLRGRAVVLGAHAIEDQGFSGRLRFEGNRVAWDADGPPDPPPRRFERYRQSFPEPSTARSLFLFSGADVAFEGNHVRLSAPEWGEQIEASADVRGKSVRAIGNRFEEGADEVLNSYRARASDAMNLAMGNQADHCIRLEGTSPMNVHNQERRCASSTVSNTHAGASR